MRGKVALGASQQGLERRAERGLMPGLTLVRLHLSGRLSRIGARGVGEVEA